MGRRYVSKNRGAASSRTASLDSGPPERWQHGSWAFTATDSGGNAAVRALEECALDRLLIADVIDEQEHEAGLRLRGDYHHAQVRGRTCRLYTAAHKPAPGTRWVSSAERRTEAAEAAYQRWRAALRAVGAAASPLLVAVCCEDTEGTGGQCALSCHTLLRRALQELARHYRLSA